ncbi:MAG: helix-turn-helix transcriptional regulator [Candidatus Acidiferrales bacterium]
MTGEDLKKARQQKGWTQVQAAQRLRMTQAYLSMLERGQRGLSDSVLRRAHQNLSLAPTALPLPGEPSALPSPNDAVRSELAALGYPGFSYLQRKPDRNPAEVLFSALNQSDLDTRVAEGLPWLTLTYADMNWDWLVRHAKVHDRQNRLGFTVTLAQELATKVNDTERAASLEPHLLALRQSLLAREDTFCHDSMTETERKWLRQNRPPAAQQWNLLTDLAVEHLAHVLP